MGWGRGDLGAELRGSQIKGGGGEWEGGGGRGLYQDCRLVHADLSDYSILLHKLGGMLGVLGGQGFEHLKHKGHRDTKDRQ